MGTLETAYRILYSLEHKKKADFMGTVIGPASLGVDEGTWSRVVKSLLDEGYITGITFSESICGETRVDIEHARITLKGAEYLQENSVMRKFAAVATNVISVAKI